MIEDQPWEKEKRREWQWEREEIIDLRRRGRGERRVKESEAESGREIEYKKKIFLSFVSVLFQIWKVLFFCAKLFSILEHRMFVCLICQMSNIWH